jgi:diketogulonate reductase-like aldo/keto reductase
MRFADGATVPALGLGTWKMGERKASAAREVAALRHGIELGMTLIDTAEMYGEGGAEEVVARAIAGRRDDVFVVSKVYPHNAGAKSAIAACERSLRRLGIDTLDLYLLHWPGRIPLAETVDAFERLRRAGKIARWGVSNFDVDAMEELAALRDGTHCATNQVLYNLVERGIEWRLLEWCAQRAMPVMAYSPVGQGALVGHRKLATLAAPLGVTPAQLALAWSIRHPHVISIPQSTDPHHIDDNRSAAAIRLSPETLAALDAVFPPPRRATRLSVL